MNKLLKTFALAAVSILLVGCNGGGTVDPSSNPYDNDPHEPYSGYDNYYQSLYRDARGVRLQLAIHNLVYSTHTTYVQYGEMRNHSSKTDMDPENTSKLLHFYTGWSGTSYGDREHVWPCANSSGLWSRGAEVVSPDADISKETYKGGGSDLYHVRSCDSNVNQTRGNSKFTEFTSADTDVSYYAEKSGAKYQLAISADKSKAEPNDAYKGDIARMLCYIYIHYTALNGEEKYCGDLSLSNIMYKPNTESDEFIWKRLWAWNLIDPVSEQERMRNDNVQAIQGNRNPFVDYPELIGKMFNLV